MSEQTTFQESADTKFVGSKFIKIQPESLISYNPRTQNQVKFHIPKSTGFVDFSKSFLRYRLSMRGRGRPTPDQSVHSLWRDVRVLTGDNQQLEMISDYNVAVNTWYQNSANKSIENKRDLFEGRSINEKNTNQLFYGEPGDWTTAATRDTWDRKSVKVQHPVHSGVLSGKTFPLALTGLRTELTLDKVGRSLWYNNIVGEEADPIVTNADILGATGGTAAARQEKTAIGDEFTCELVFTNRETMPFDIGDRLYIDVAAGGSEKSLGVVTEFTVNAGNLVVKFVPDRAVSTPLGTDYPAGSSVYYKKADRLNGVTVSDVPAAQITGAAEQTSYIISDIEMVLLQVEPPEQYIKSMMKAVGTEKGINMDFVSWALYKYNLPAVAGVTDQNIPATQSRALSTVSVPLPIARQDDLTFSSMVGALDGAKEYQWVYGNKLYPNRPLEMARFTQGRSEPFVQREVNKALNVAGYPVRNILSQDQRFVFARAWAKQGQVKNLADESLSLRIEYESPSLQKLFNHYVRHLVRVNISKNGVMVSA